MTGGERRSSLSSKDCLLEAMRVHIYKVYVLHAMRFRNGAITLAWGQRMPTGMTEQISDYSVVVNVRITF